MVFEVLAEMDIPDYVEVHTCTVQAGVYVIHVVVDGPRGAIFVPSGSSRDQVRELLKPLRESTGCP